MQFEIFDRIRFSFSPIESYFSYFNFEIFFSLSVLKIFEEKPSNKLFLSFE